MMSQKNFLHMKQLRDIYVLFIGIYDGYEEKCSRDEWLTPFHLYGAGG